MIPAVRKIKNLPLPLKRYSVIVEVTKDVVVDAIDEEDAKEQVRKLLDEARKKGYEQILAGTMVESLFSAGQNYMHRPEKVDKDYISDSGDDHGKDEE